MCIFYIMYIMYIVDKRQQIVDYRLQEIIGNDINDIKDIDKFTLDYTRLIINNKE